MGQILEKPITEKKSDSAAPSGSLQLEWASSCMQGWRTGMEDAHICLGDLGKLRVAQSTNWRGVALFGVFDGHGGEQVAKFSERHLAEVLCGFPVNLEVRSQASTISSALTESFHKIDDLLREGRCVAELQTLTNPPAEVAAQSGLLNSGRSVDPHQVGCTACVCAITEDLLVVANAGDSRAVLCRAGAAIALSQDHKPNLPGERRRIEAAGGSVQASGPGQWRVNGNLNLSRALGDLEYKKDKSRKPEAQIICSTPDVTTHQRNQADEFLIICCDGVWDMKSNQEVVDFVCQRLPPRGPPEGMERILEDLLDSCLSPNLRVTKGLGGDNMSAVLVRFPRSNLSSKNAASETGPLSFARPSRPQLLKAWSTSLTARTGTLQARIKMPQESSAKTCMLGVNQETSEIEIICSIGEQANHCKFHLSAYLPQDAAFHSPASPAKICLKSQMLRLTLHWFI